MELINTGGRPIKELTEVDVIQVEALAAVCVLNLRWLRTSA